MVKYRFVDDEPEEKKPVARFRYVKADQFGNEEKVTFYGEQFELGEVTEVDSEYAANKLRTVWKDAFEEVGDGNGDAEDGSDPGDPGKPRRRGRPRMTDEEKAEAAARREAEKAAEVTTDLGPDDTTFEEGEPF